MAKLLDGAESMSWRYDDGGRAAAGFRGHAGDCVARSIAIASGLPYSEVYTALARGNARQRVTKRSKASSARKRTARSGIYVRRKWFKNYMASLGFVWTPTMLVGQGCKVHLLKGELPAGRLVVSLSKHYTAVVDGEIRDTFDPAWCTIIHHPDGTKTLSHRCVYGYWRYCPS